MYTACIFNAFKMFRMFKTVYFTCKINSNGHTKNVYRLAFNVKGLAFCTFSVWVYANKKPS